MKNFKITFHGKIQEGYSWTEDLIARFRYDKKYNFLDNQEWEDLLTFERFDHSNNDFNAIWKSKNDGRTFRMTSREFEKVCNGEKSNSLKIDGKLSIIGKFTFKKTAQRIHIILL